MAPKTGHASVGGERAGSDGPDVPALGGPLRGGRAGGPEGQAGGGAVSSAGVAQGGGGAGGAVPGRLCGVERASLLPRGLRGRARRGAVVHLGEEPPSGGGPGEEGAQEGCAPAQAGAQGGGGDDAPPGRLDARMGSRPGVGPGRDDGRRDERGVLGVLRRGGGNVVEPSGRRGDGEGAGALRQPVHGPGLALLAHAAGGREGGQGQADPVRPGDGRARDRDDRRVLAAGAGPERAAVRDASGAPAAGAGAGGDHRHGRGQRVPEGLLAAVQRGICGGGEGGEARVHPVAAADEGQAARHPLPEGDTDGWQRQLRDLQGQDAADPASAAPVHLRASQGQGPRIRGRRHGRLPRHPEARALRCERQVATPSAGRRWQREAVPPPPSARSARLGGRRYGKADTSCATETGHFICYRHGQ